MAHRPGKLDGSLALLDALPDAIVAVDDEGIIRLANRQASTLFGYTREQLVGRTVDDLVPEAIREAHPGHRARYRGAPVTRPMGVGLQLAARRSDGTTFPAEISLSPLQSEGGVLVAAAVRDVSERKQIEQERDALRRRQSERLESLGQLAGGVAHDFNNLLAVILSYARFAEEALVDRVDVRADVAEIRRAAERAQELVHQLLIFGRREITKPEILDLDALIKGVASLLRRALGEHVELETNGFPGLWQVEADPGQLEQVLVNLAVNARDAMRDGGRLRISTANVLVEPDTPVTHGEVTQRHYVRLDVRDSGVGMSADIVERIFDPFFTTKPKGEGTGLGLATVYGIVLSAGGFIDVRSVEGEGTAFGVHLPAIGIVLDPGDVVVHEGHGARMPGRGEHVLVVEDEPAVREVLRRILDRHGYVAIVAEDPEDALERAMDQQQRIDLLLSDVVMPRMLGPELAAAVHEIRPDLPTLYVSGYSYDVMVHEGRLTADAPMVPKPFSEEQLLAAIRDVLDG